MKENIACYRIPSIATAPNGDIIAAKDERVPNGNDLNRNNVINIVVRRSADNGKTWYFIDTPIKPADESKIMELVDGSWMINSRVNDGYKKNRLL